MSKHVPATLFSVEGGIRRSAELSECGRYRWWLRRCWDGGGTAGQVCFIMLNPSTADAYEDDPTIRRCIGFARAWGYGDLVVRNLFALRATNPKELLTANEPIGGQRGVEELRLARYSDLVVAAWGAGAPFGWDKHAADVHLRGIGLKCLGLTKKGCPRHPLYLRADQKPVHFLD